MRVGEVCNRVPEVIGAEESVQAAAERMREYHVGNLVVVDDTSGKRVPIGIGIGIVTDRDLVLEILVPGLDPATLLVRDAASAPLVTVGSQDSLFAAMELMETKAVRRLPVVEPDGSLGGIITVDDIMAFLTGLQGQLAGVVNRQRKKEAQRRP
ncbi:CBS domain-containing protein [Guyparkeria sp. 1SP6A2]|nr:CBS domain-containing protein [Guyparkeria sp. 1SP6A2]